jgi:hypothetical protein
MERQPQIGDLVRYGPRHNVTPNHLLPLAVITHVEGNDFRLMWVKGRGKLSKFEWLSQGNIEVVARA